MNRFLLVLLTTIPLYSAELISQQNADSATVHTPFTVELTIKKTASEKIIPADTAGWIKTLAINAVETKPVGADVKVIYHLSAYAPPSCSIPSFKVYSVPSDSGGKTDTIASKPFIIPVKTIITDTGKVASAEFGGPMEAGKFPIKKVITFLFMVVLAAALLVGIIALIRWYIMKRKNKNFWGEDLNPQLPPYDEAMLALSKIESDKLLETGQLKEVVFLLSEILKRYIGRRFECHVQEATSSEFRKWIAVASLTREQKNVLERFISVTDPMKFANIMPGLSEVGSLLTDVKSFVIDTKPAETNTKEDK